MAIKSNIPWTRILKAVLVAKKTWRIDMQQQVGNTEQLLLVINKFHYLSVTAISY